MFHRRVVEFRGMAEGISVKTPLRLLGAVPCRTNAFTCTRVSPSGGEGYSAGSSSVDLGEYVFDDGGEAIAILLRRKRAKARPHVC